MDSGEIKEKHLHIQKELGKNRLGVILKIFLTEMPKQEFKWVLNYLKHHNLDLDDKENKKNVEKCFFLHKMFFLEEFYFTSLGNYTETSVEVDFFSSQTNLLFSCKLEKESIDNSDLKRFSFSVTRNRGHNVVTPISIEKGLECLNILFKRL